ncbi:MAG: DMT family transporter [Chloroflexi bacterium]|nr:DMT family transporter [Chloroflexota bacterium]
MNVGETGLAADSGPGPASRTRDQPSPDLLLTYALLLLAVALWAGTWVAGKLAVQQLSPLFVGTARYVVSLAVLLPWLAYQRQLTAFGRRDVGPLFGLGLTYVVGVNLLYLSGLQFAPASDGALLAPGLSPILSVGLAALALHERLTRGQGVGFGLALVGLAFLLGVGGAAEGGARLLGNLLYLGSAVLWGLQTVLVRVHTYRLSPAVTSSYSILFGSLVLLPFALLDGGWRALGAVDAPTWLSFLYLALPGTGLPVLFWFQGIQRLGVARSSVFSYLIPVFGVALSMVFLDERLHLLQFLGGALVLGGVALVNRNRLEN